MSECIIKLFSNNEEIEQRFNVPSVKDNTLRAFFPDVRIFFLYYIGFAAHIDFIAVFKCNKMV